MDNIEARKKIAARMKALALMTVQNGASEAEAAMALETLNRMQAEYNTSLNPDTLLNEEGMGLMIFPQALKDAWPSVAAISALTNTRGIVDEELSAILFVGTKHDAEYALYLFAIVQNALHASHNKFMLTEEYRKAWKTNDGNYIRRSFMAGVVDRLCNRIMAMIPKPEVQTKTSNALVVIKENASEQFLNNMGIETQTSLSTDLAVDKELYTAGEKAGDKVALNKGIGTHNHDKRLN